MLKPAKRTPPNTSRNKNPNTQRTENNTTDVVIHQYSRKLQKMDILMSETCWAHNKWKKIAGDIKSVFHSSTIAMMHGPINIRYTNNNLLYDACSTSGYYLEGIFHKGHNSRWQCLFHDDTTRNKVLQFELLLANKALECWLLNESNLIKM